MLETILIITGFIVIELLLILIIYIIFEKLYFKYSAFGKIYKLYRKGKLEKEDANKFYFLINKYLFEDTRFKNK